MWWLALAQVSVYIGNPKARGAYRRQLQRKGSKTSNYAASRKSTWLDTMRRRGRGGSRPRVVSGVAAASPTQQGQAHLHGKRGSERSTAKSVQRSLRARMGCSVPPPPSLPSAGSALAVTDMVAAAAVVVVGRSWARGLDGGAE